jgi:adenylosuccinate synthase
MFEGAQGVLLDVDHGTYPFVTSSSTTAGGACAACGIGPTEIDSVMGIAKAYATRVGAGPFPTELHDATGETLRRRGNEFGSTTGRPRRCGWLDLPALRLAIRLSGIQGIGLTKLDVLSGLPSVKLCTGYRVDGRVVDEMPLDADDLAGAEPIYEEMPGWPEGEDVPPAAARFVERISALAGIPIWVTSVGPGRAQTIVTRNPFVAA